MHAIFQNKRIIVSLAIILNLFVFLGLFIRATDVDEGIIAAHSYYLNECGYVKSPHFHNAEFGWENRQYHYHKLTVWIGAGISKIFGFHLVVFRLIPYLSYLLFLWVLYKLLQLKKLSINYFWLFQIIFLINSTVFYFGFIYRPEIMVMSMGFISYFLIEKENHKASYISIVWAGFFAGLAMLLHLNGVVFIVAGTFLLFLRKRFIKGFIFGAVGSITSLFYFADTLSSRNFLNWKTQFFSDPNLIEKKASPFLKILDEHMRFFHSEREIIFSVLVLLCLIVGAKKIRLRIEGMFWYFCILVISLNLISHGTTTKYLILYMPFMVFIVVSVLLHFNDYKKYQKILLGLSLLTFVAYHTFVDGKIMAKSYNVVERNHFLAKKIPEKNTLIFANEGFVFDEISNFTIQSYCAFNFHYSTFHPNEELTLDGLFEFLSSGKTRYILIDRKIDNGKIFSQIPYDKLEVGNNFYRYKVIDKSPEFILFEIQNMNIENEQLIHLSEAV